MAAEAPPPPKVPQAPRKPLSRGLKLGLVAATVAGVMAIGAIYFFQQRNRTPSEGLVKAEIEKQIGGAQLKVTEISPTITPTGPGQADIHYHAVAVLTEPLYEQLEATAVLRDQLKLDLDAWQKARKTLAGQGGARILELAGLKGVDDTLLQTTFLKEVSPKGQQVQFDGRLRASKSEGGWKLETQGGNTAAGAPQGQPRANFPGRTSVVSDPSELEKLRELAKAQAEVPVKIEQAMAAYAQERQAEQEKAMAQSLESMAPGTLFAGTAKGGTGAPTPLYLEITTLRTKEKQVIALLRNEGGWSDARTFQGSFAASPVDGALTVTLVTQRGQAVRKGGPFLERNESWQVVFQFSEGRLTGRSGDWEYALTRLSEPDAAARKKELDGEAGLLREATLAGKVYRGTIRGKSAPDTFECLLRFKRQENDGEVLGLTIEPVGRDALQRTFRGTIIGSRLRAEGWPLRLETKAREAVKAAAGNALLAGHEDITVSLKLDNGRLVGESKNFTWDFGSVATEELAKLDTDKAQREKQILALVKEGALFYGKAHPEGESQTEGVRLRIRHIEPGGTVVDAILESLETNGVSREFRGPLDLYEGRLELTTSARGRGKTGVAVHFPAFVDSKAEMVISLTLVDGKFTGELKPSNWRLEF